MTHKSLRVVTTIIVLGSVASASAQDGPPGPPRYIGPDSCIPCHRSGSGAPAGDYGKISAEFCLLTEVPTLGTKDPHVRAWKVLETEPEENEIARRMQKALGGEAISKRHDCLTCHSTGTSVDGSEELPAHYQLGVSCEGCHGPSSHWEKPHREITWRLEDVEKKNSLGLIDVRNPVTRANLCYSCHIGDASKGRIVTHEMYAAGHPPLPGIEIETFASQMPRHWRYVREKGDFKNRDQYIAKAFPSYSGQIDQDLPQTRAVVIGGVVALRATANLMATAAANGKTWPELAVFDCAACHHDLRSPAWRQQRGYGNRVPGRPTMFTWSTALVKLGLHQVADGNDAALQAQTNEFHQQLADFHNLTTNRPFGERDALGAIANGKGASLISWLDGFANTLMSKTFDEAAARDALNVLYNLPENAYPDYHSARQIAWAILTIETELAAGYPAFREDESPVDHHERVQREFQTQQQRMLGMFSTAAGDSLSMKDSLRLELRPNTDDSIGMHLGQSLDVMRDYDPEVFRKQLQALAQKRNRSSALQLPQQQ